MYQQKKGQEITFSINSNIPDDIEVYLEDTKTDNFIRMDETGSFYRISLTDDLYGKGRFYLHTKAGTLSSSVYPIDTPYVIYSNGNFKWNGLSEGNWNLKITDVLGKEIIAKKGIKSPKGIVRINTVKKGVYIVSMHSNKEKITRKIMIE